ncbi:thiol peroxidase [Pseudoalteromonas denitrificans]|uniref:Thiol peroxidase n=1 Tax=Pseudoalteromonas denitrificans DSM 6059 TaxID=1123010 RepID=A0A1I1SYT1_9GAMM|nr:thiol peroxidase [Pseudoalteromonas denitrificans]SFD49093.1 thiol peroxidase (atypical 2-Cys peroxiredoxin) [Pseudoalteromonas denitrificans DSM 6059]
MNQVTFQGQKVEIAGILPTVGAPSPDFTLTASDLSELTLSQVKGKNIILNIFPSIDTPVCATSVRKFNEEAAKLDNTVIICISADLPFATGRFCEVEGMNNVQHASTFRNPDFASQFGVAINNGILKGLTTRAVICINSSGIVVHTELAQEITEEIDYKNALASISL